MSQATDRQLLAEFRRREHISTNSLLQALLKRFDIAVFVGVQDEAANKSGVTCESIGNDIVATETKAAFLHAWADEQVLPDDEPETPADDGDDEAEE